MDRAAENRLSENAVHKPNKACKTAVLVSGGGTNLQALIDYEKTQAPCPYRIEAVFSDTKKAYAIERACKAGIRTEIVSPYAILGAQGAAQASKNEKRQAVSKRILALCKERGIELIVLAGFLTVLSGKLIDEYEGRIINLHPALLPDFGGEGMWGHHVHEAVLASGKKESGCTVHFVNSGCDTGKIILQKKIPVLPGDTPETLAARLAPEEHKAIVEAVCMAAKALCI
ncbi:phosphoribosylglycinamide formyltransferase [Treponema sp. HNW]|uniref:phosphoribosylglycinamide formyltransferase n=1 Tax=Treponema sp. HNW TaxID=3116654 RepID=UPI003D0A7141